MTNHLLLIAIGKYKHWHTLEGPKRDADALRDILFRKYGFSPERTIELRDAAATNENILKAFRQWKDASPEDQLLIYYAGHGHTDEFDKTGFWIPHDAESDADQRVRWIPNASIRGALAVLPFHHILLICDSCFSGDLLDVQRGVSISQHPPNKPDYIKNSLRKRSREVLTSGSSEHVLDTGLTGHSAFAFHLIDTLKTNPEPWIDAIRLYDHIRCGVSGQQPLYGWLNSAGHQRGGAFVFIDVKADRWPTTDDTKETSQRKGSSRSLQDAEVIDAAAATDDSDQRIAGAELSLDSTRVAIQCMESGDFTTAAKLLEDAQLKDPLDGFVRVARVVALLGGKTPAALSTERIRKVDEILRSVPKTSEHYFAAHVMRIILADIYTQICGGRYVEATPHETAVTHKPLNAEMTRLFRLLRVPQPLLQKHLPEWCEPV